MEYRKLESENIPAALELAWRVFMEFEAPDYPSLGIESFRAYLDEQMVDGYTRKRPLLFWGCYHGGGIVGMLALRPPGHISLLFVDPVYQKRGIAKRLFNLARNHCKSIGFTNKMTAHASPYALKVYQRLGFTASGPEQLEDGLRFIPMEYQPE